MKTIPIDHKDLMSARTPALSVLTKAIRASVIGMGLASGVSQAATIEVTSNSDDGSNCTLREAIVSINNSKAGSALLETGCSNSGAAFGTADSITFANSLSPANTTIVLTGGQLSIAPDKDVTIDASSIGSGITVDANQLSRAFYASSATLTLDNMTITKGLADFGAGIAALSSSFLTLNNSALLDNSAQSGGGISTVISTVVLNNSTVSGNTASTDNGGGIYARDANLKLDNSTVSDNFAFLDGGGVYARVAYLNLNNSTFKDNVADEDGGGIYVWSPIATLNEVTISGNGAAEDGGGVYARLSILGLTNSTLTNNTAADGGGLAAKDATVTLGGSTLYNNSAANGGGISAKTSANITLENSTVSGNSVSLNGGGISAVLSSDVALNNSTLADNISHADGGSIDVRNAGSSLTISNSIIANSIGGTDCKSVSIPVTTDTASIISDDSCVTLARSGDPHLGPLANNGGKTKTHALKFDSIARDTGVLSGAASPLKDCTINDQRGQLRDTGDGACDVGAIEFFDDGFIVIPFSNGKVTVVPL